MKPKFKKGQPVRRVFGLDVSRKHPYLNFIPGEVYIVQQCGIRHVHIVGKKMRGIPFDYNPDFFELDTDRIMIALIKEIMEE